jgi:uncharacterized alpha-E superfamily protein
MLSRTAESLYWTSRYVERVETSARLMEVGYRMSMMPREGGGHANEWAPIVAASGNAEPFEAAYGEATEENVINFVIFDENNPSSIKSCIRAARENVRAARPALTSQVWETINDIYLQFQQIEAKRSQYSLSQFCDWVKMQTAAVRGAYETTQLQNEGYHFFNLGAYIERADNTARLLDVKYYVLLPTIDMIGGSVDQYQWSALLRAMSAQRAFHWAYRGEYSPKRIAHFLILNITFPRSLLHCVEQADLHLTRLARGYKNRTRANSYISGMLGELGEADISDIIAEGLHEFLADFIARNQKLNDTIARSYLFGQN